MKASSSGVRLQFDEGPGAEEQQIDDGKTPSTSGEAQRRSLKISSGELKGRWELYCCVSRS